MMSEPKAVMRSAYVASGATELEFMAAMLGVLSTKVDAATWNESAALALDCFRDRSKP